MEMAAEFMIYKTLTPGNLLHFPGFLLKRQILTFVENIEVINLPCFITFGELHDLQLNPELCLELAGKNNPEVFNRKVRRLQSARSVDLAKKNSKMKAALA